MINNPAYRSICEGLVMFIIIGNGHSNQSSNLEQNCLHHANTLGKDKNPTILPQAMGK